MMTGPIEQATRGADTLTKKYTSAAAQLDTKGRRLAEIAQDQLAALNIRSAIFQALHCLDHGLELSYSARSDIEHFLRLHQYAADPLGACVQGLNWLLFQLAARDAVRETCLAKWIHSGKYALHLPERELANALDAGLCAAATGEPLDEKYRAALIHWGTGDCDPLYKEAVQQLLRQCS